MKKLYFLLVGICFFGNVDAQIINFPDPIFKAKLLTSHLGVVASDLLGNNIIIDSNNDGEIQIDEANNQNIKRIYLSNANIQDITGIEFFKNLEFIDCSHNLITSLNVRSLNNLKDLYCGDNLLISLNCSKLTNLDVVTCENNYLTDIDLNGCTKFRYLRIYNNLLPSLNLVGLGNLEGVEASDNKIVNVIFDGAINLWNLDLSDNLLETLDVTSLKKLGGLDCSRNKLVSLNVSGLSKLQGFSCEDNNLTTLDLSGLLYLSTLVCSHNNLTSLKLNDCNELYSLNCEFNNLTHLLIKNGITESNLNFSNNPNLKFICSDEEQALQIKYFISVFNISNINFNSYCSFTPGGTFYTFEGNSKFDVDSNGCDVSDDKISNFNFSITDGTNKGNIISNATGDCSIAVGEGTHTITPILENLTYFTVSPSAISVTFPTQTSPFIQNFCITPNGVHNDLEVTILPTIPARPGFDATYKIIYKNKGNQTQSGSVSLSFNDAVLDYVSAIPSISNQTTDKLTWDYINLKPLETREITVTFNVNSPMETPAVNIGDRLSFNALITPVIGDEKPVDNSSALRQSVVGSFDPNDKTCLEGDVITPSLIGEYVNYLIRFENTGTYPAQNIVVKDLIDLSKFDISTLIPTKASHDFVTKISEGNKVEFIFEKINLPFDDANNDGYIAFKIKTLPTLAVGDSFENEANIYFDYNFPVLTNKATSTFKTLGTQDFEFSNYFSVYPSPANDILNISLKNSIEVASMAVYDILGQLVIAVPDAQKVSTIDVSKLITGNYFLKMKTDKGASTVKFIKN
jgi:Cu/Ag efflux protein CusF